MISSIFIEHKQYNLTSVFCLHTVELFNNSMWLIDRSLTGTISLGQSRHGSNDNEYLGH